MGLHLLAWTAVAAAAGAALGPLSAAAVARWPAGRALLRPRPRSALWGALSRRRPRPPRSAVAIELAGAGAAAAGAAVAGPGWGAVAGAVLLAALVPVVLIDLRHRLIPDAVVLPAAALALAAAMAARPARWWEPPAAALGAAGVLLLPWIVRPDAMGLGDVKLALLIGAALGAAVVPALAAAFAAAAVAGAALVARHGAGARRMTVPFGPFLAGGALVGLAWGPAMLDWYAARLA